MNISELIDNLIELRDKHGDMPVLYYSPNKYDDYMSLVSISAVFYDDNVPIDTRTPSETMKGYVIL